MPKNPKTELARLTNETKDLLTEIHSALMARTSVALNGTNWGHVGDAADTVRILKDLRDRLTQSGEYALVKAG